MLKEYIGIGVTHDLYLWLPLKICYSISLMNSIVTGVLVAVWSTP